MISYDLAKQLKDAGFPLKEATFSDEFLKCTSFDGGITVCVIPTLSELIEACGDMYMDLENPDGKWWFEVWDKIGRVRIAQESGLTPEEAVSRVWLELNKK